MDIEKPLEDQFTKLHPCFPLDTRIAILGAGPSGLSSAYALVKLGYRNITVLEKHHTVGGMCESVDIEGKIYDLGGQVLAANSAPAIFHLAKEIGAEFEELDSHKFALIDTSTGKFRDMKLADDYVSIIPLTLKLQEDAKNSNRIGVHAVSEVASSLTPEFLMGHGLQSVPKAVAYGYTASGYGFVQDMPYAYIHEFIRTSMAGKIRRFKGGYTSLWQKISRTMPIEVQHSTEVLAITRNSVSISVDVKNIHGETKALEFDKIIISGSFPFKNGKTYRSPSLTLADIKTEIIDMSELEKKLFSKVQTIDYYTTVMKIKGLEHIPMGFYYFPEFMEDPTTIGHPVALQRFYADTDIFLFWSYGNSEDINGPRVTMLATEVVMKMGATVEVVVLQRRFKYFPHIKSQDMKLGFYDKVESELQGLNNTYYVGGLMAFELTERNSSYAMALACKHFATESVLPPFPYVKAMLPLQSDHRVCRPRKSDEIPELQFPDLSTLDGYLKHWGMHRITQSKTLYTWINEVGVPVCQRTYGQLHANASHIAHKLLTNRKPVFKAGDRVLLVYVPGLDFIDAFFGCLRAKVLPVPVLPPDPMQRGGQALLKIENISKACNAVAILSSLGYHSAVRAGFVKNMISFTKTNGKSSSCWPDLPWFHTDSWIKSSSNMHPEDISTQPESQPNDLCFLQFTSGSTGDAKGVMITHGGLIHNVKLMRQRYKSTSNTVLVSWLPQYHDMGLIGGLFSALVAGGTAILFSPLTFIKNPLLWLQTMSEYRATHSAGPNFAFELVLRRLESYKDKTYGYDLSSMTFLMIAAEPVRQKTVKRFLDLTRPFLLSPQVMAPGYGLAENCVFVSCAFGEGNPILVDWQGRVCCGYVSQNDPDFDIRIVDPETGKEHDEQGKEGEIWISSPSAGIGYWGKEELSHNTFKNVLQYCPGKRFTRTGDLGRILDNKLFITGRIKDLIIVAGRNIYSADVEKTVENSSDLIRPGCCAVIGVPEDILSAKGISVPENSDQLGLVVIAEVRDGKPVNKEVMEQIQTCVAEEHGVPVASIRLIKPRTMSKTTSGKIRRFDCLKQFTDGTLSLVTESGASKRTLFRSFTTGTCREGKTPRPNFISRPLSQNARISNQDITEFLKKLVSKQTGVRIEKISSNESLVSYGIDSIGVVRAAQELSDFLGVPVGAVDIFTATCIADLASFSENLLVKCQPQPTIAPSFATTLETDPTRLVIKISRLGQLGIGLLQLLAIIYGSSLLILPAYLSVSLFLSFLSATSSLIQDSPILQYFVSLSVAPLAWILCMFLTCIFICLFGNSFLQPNYALTPDVPIWSTAFVRWWILYKVQQVAGKVLAVHLRGTVFLNYWFEMLGARIGSSVVLDTIDITDPSLVSIGNGAVIAEGSLIQSHEVMNGSISFLPVRIGSNACVGPYAVIQKGSNLDEDVEILPLQKTEEGKPLLRTDKSYKAHKMTEVTVKSQEKLETLYHCLGIYIVGFLSSSSAAIMYFLHLHFSQNPPSLQHFAFLCVAGAFHWFPFTIIAYATMISSVPSNPVTFALSVGIAYLVHGLILSLLSGILTRCLSGKQETQRYQLKIWLRHRITIACHLRFAQFLSGTEAFCMYLRLLGAKVGQHCSIRAINPVSDPELISIGNGVHLGDFSRIIAGFYSSSGVFNCQKVEIQDNSVVGSQSLILPGSVIQKDVILGALSVAPVNSVLQRGGVYVGSQNPIMVKNTSHILDERIEKMDAKYKRIVGNLAGNLAVTTMKVKSRYFHRIGVGGKGTLKIFDHLPGLPDHKIFHAGKTYPVIIRHSNSLSADDDARIDARGAALRILHCTENEDGTANKSSALLDLTLKTGRAFYARTIADFTTWLVCGLAAREEYVKRAPHVREAVWDSLRKADSYAELHYYSNVCRLLRCNNGEEMYVKFKLRPLDDQIGEDSGKVEPMGILPPETGAIPRDENDTRPPLFLANDFQNRVSSPGGVSYIFQLQLRPAVSNNENERETVLDCTKPWDSIEFPFIDVGMITIDQKLTCEESEQLDFNPFLQCKEIDIIRATSCSESASIDHGRSLVYEICQHLRNCKPLPEAWRIFLEQSDVKVNLSGCPMAAAVASMNKDTGGKLTLERTWDTTLWAIICQPLLQIIVPYFLLGLVVFEPLNLVLYMKEMDKLSLHWMLPLLWVSSGVLAGFLCVVAKWVLVGSKEDGQIMLIWSKEVFMDTIWQASKTLIGDYFMEMASGSLLFGLWMKLMGSKLDLEQVIYVDSMGALLNPEMVEIEKGGCVGRDALLFGHIYEGEGGNVKFGKIRVGEGGFVGSKAVVMPGVRVDSWGNLSALSLAMKEEIVRSR
ncbi:Long-chain-fatty-acid--amp ligase fadd26 [Thalictrum thalictroides]|uniref:Long-chain-fatty-acid--amp ligase fadd26 n=1 Tax=Thalictrum thalictroides TaxID=46969 RepID=A0A7J6W2E0_THATH|nr:Long-chain-fatty-acid--amp ligase fadd26 [Thalictrum thalictroides]